MAKENKILILGKGRIGEGIKHYLAKQRLSLRVDFFSKEKDVKNAKLLISALPGKNGEIGLNLALKFKKDLIDVSDLDPPFYWKNKKRIEACQIRVFPECGFSPGLTNLICGFESFSNKIKKIEILAGSLSKAKFFFPFLWCLEDLIEGHKIKANFIQNGKRVFLPPFSEYQKEKINGLDAESYFMDGLSSLPSTLKIKNMNYRVLRPFGFFYFFQFLKNQGFLDKNNLAFTKNILEKGKSDNTTLAKIKLLINQKKIIWEIKSFAKKNEKMNSMQKITCFLPATIAKFLLENKIKQKGILFMEEMGKNETFFREILNEIKKEKNLILKRRNTD